MADNKQNVTVSFPLAGLLTVAFVVLKLCHVIDWSWWWVLAPIWIPVAIVLIIAIIVGLMVNQVGGVNLGYPFSSFFSYRRLCER